MVQQIARNAVTGRWRLACGCGWWWQCMQVPLALSACQTLRQSLSERVGALGELQQPGRRTQDPACAASRSPRPRHVDGGQRHATGLGGSLPGCAVSYIRCVCRALPVTEQKFCSPVAIYAVQLAGLLDPSMPDRYVQPFRC
jgi:hypothetical protein